MKKLIIATLVFLLFGCTNEYVLHANLRSVNDRKEIRTDEMDNDIKIRSISVFYLAINKCNDSIFIPIGDPYDNSITINVMTRDSLKVSYFGESCKMLNRTYDHHLFAPGDTIVMKFRFHVYPGNSNDNEWLQKVSTKELVSKLEINMNKPMQGKNTDRIPDIIFNNDTNDILINPIIRVNKDTIKGEARDACRH